MNARDETGHAVLVASEPLSDDPGWREVPANHLVRIEPDRSVRIEPIPGV